jgi:uncharacterized protein YcnI
MFASRLRVCAAAVLLIGGVHPAFAHVIARPDQGAAGSTVTVELFVAHGCEGSPTTALHVTLPDGVTDVTPRDKSGWTLSRQGKEIDWRGGSIAAHDHDSFFISLKLPEGAGHTLYFPAIQTCQKGENRWFDIPAVGQDRKSLKWPAPFLSVTPKAP